MCRQAAPGRHPNDTVKMTGCDVKSRRIIPTGPTVGQVLGD